MDSDLISRKALLQLLYEKWLNKMPNRTCFFLDGEIQRTAEAETIEKIMKEIEGVPTVDAVEVVHGEWIGLISEDFVCAEGFNTGMTEKQKGKCLEDFYHRTHCSICNCCFDDRDVKNWNYCPNCGSKMDGGKRDEM